MTTLALRSVRADPARFAVTALAVGLSTVLVGSFATLLETATGPIPPTEQETLVILGGVVLAWGSIIAVFAPLSTVSVLVDRRRVEIDTLRTVGATPRQARRLVVAETAVVAALSALAGALAAYPLGRVLLDRFVAAGFVGPRTPYGAGPLSLGSTALLMVVLAACAATVAARPRASGAEQGEMSARLPLWRRVVGGLLLWSGASGAVTAVVLSRVDDDPYLPMQVAGPAGMLAAAGCAALAPALIRWCAPIGSRLVGRGPAGALAAHSLRYRGRVLAPVLGPVIVLTATATGTLLLVGTDARTLVLPPDVTRQQADSITLLNVFVALMVSLFMAIMAVNALVAAVSSRRDELTRVRLAGATPGQVLGVVTREALFVGGVGTVVGTVCAALTACSFALARDEGVVPDGQIWLPVLVGAIVFTLTVVASRAAAQGVAVAPPEAVST